MKITRFSTQIVCDRLEIAILAIIPEKIGRKMAYVCRKTSILPIDGLLAHASIPALR